jgi:TonB-linked SusC/RagA family outer membrane protein
VDNATGFLAIGSPVAQANGTINNRAGTRLFGNVFADINLAKNLKFRTSFGADINNTRLGTYAFKNLTLPGRQNQGRASQAFGNSLNYLLENTLTYNLNIKDDHHFVFLGGLTSQTQTTENLSVVSNIIPYEGLTFNGISTGSGIFPASNNADKGRLNSVLGRLNYDYKNKYLLTATVRGDGSSKFADKKKWGVFPSVSLAWRVSEEKFLEPIKAISDLKIRGSYGATGNNEIPAYSSIAVYNQQNYSFNNQLAVGFAPTRFNNTDLAWETTYQTDLGLDLSLIDSRINITADYYNKKTVNLLFGFPLPATTGQSNFVKNVGTLKNNGFEFGLNTVNTKGAFKWTTTFNIATNRNKAIDIGTTSKNLPSGGSISPAFITSIGVLTPGQPVGNFFGYEFLGIYQNQAEIDASPKPTSGIPKPGDRKYADLNGDNVINTDDRKVLGQAQPKVYGGITNNISYKGFDFSLFIQGVSGNSVLNSNRFELENLTGINNQSREVLNRWTPTNPSNTIPRANRNGGVSLLSSRQVEDGSFIRIKNLVFGYTLPESVTKNLRLASCRVYFSSQNLHTFTKYSGLDPEVSRFGATTLTSGVDYGSYPTNRSYLLGLNVSF